MMMMMMTMKKKCRKIPETEYTPPERDGRYDPIRTSQGQDLIQIQTNGEPPQSEK